LNVNNYTKLKICIITGILIFTLLMPVIVHSQPLPKVTIGLDQAQKPGDVAVTLQIILLLTILSLAPALLIMLTSFTRVMIIFSFLRHALGTQQAPPTQVMVGLALFLTVFIMSPVWQDINTNSLQPYLDQRISQKQAYETALVPIRNFMFKQTREKDLGLFLKIAHVPKPNDYSEVPTHVLIPAFIISEFRIAFQIGFLLFIPFLMLDMIVADGWYLVVESIITGFK